MQEPNHKPASLTQSNNSPTLRTKTLHDTISVDGSSPPTTPNKDKAATPFRRPPPLSLDELSNNPLIIPIIMIDPSNGDDLDSAETLLSSAINTPDSRATSVGDRTTNELMSRTKMRVGSADLWQEPKPSLRSAPLSEPRPHKRDSLTYSRTSHATHELGGSQRRLIQDESFNKVTEELDDGNEPPSDSDNSEAETTNSPSRPLRPSIRQQEAKHSFSRAGVASAFDTTHAARRLGGSQQRLIQDESFNQVTEEPDDGDGPPNDSDAPEADVTAFVLPGPVQSLSLTEQQEKKYSLHLGYTHVSDTPHVLFPARSEPLPSPLPQAFAGFGEDTTQELHDTKHSQYPQSTALVESKVEIETGLDEPNRADNFDKPLPVAPISDDTLRRLKKRAISANNKSLIAWRNFTRSKQPTTNPNDTKSKPKDRSFFTNIRNGNFALWGDVDSYEDTNIKGWLAAITSDYRQKHGHDSCPPDNFLNGVLLPYCVAESTKRQLPAGGAIPNHPQQDLVAQNKHTPVDTSDVSYEDLFNAVGSLIQQSEMRLPSVSNPTKLGEITQQLAFLKHLKKRAAILMLLQKKMASEAKYELLIDSLKSYHFTEPEKEKVIYALLAGDLRVTDILKRGIEHRLWSFLTFKWGNVFISKRFSRAEVLQIAEYSSTDQPFKRTPSQERWRLIKGLPLAFGKIVTSMALCLFFVLGLLSGLGAPFAVALLVAIIVSACNGGVCWYSRGQAMLNSVAFDPEKQQTYKTAAENAKEKPTSRWGRKAFFGFFTLIACVSAGATAWTGMTGFLIAIGAAVVLSNPFGLALVAALALIAAISFYSFQATGIEENYLKFKNLFTNYWKESKGKAGLMLVVSLFFLTVYGVLTWFTAASGIDKIFKMSGVKMDGFAITLAAISTVTTMFVNTFSQVFKVFNPATYSDLKKKFAHIDNSWGQGATRKERVWNKLKIIGRAFMLLGNEMAYSVAGGYQSGKDVGDQVTGSPIGAFVFAIFSPVILLLVSIAFTWPSVLNKKPTPNQTNVSNSNNSAFSISTDANSSNNRNVFSPGNSPPPTPYLTRVEEQTGRPWPQPNTSSHPQVAGISSSFMTPPPATSNESAAPPSFLPPPPTETHATATHS